MNQTNQGNKPATGVVQTVLENQAADRSQKLSHGYIKFILAALFAVGLAAGISYYRHSLFYESTDDAFIDGNIIPVSPSISGHVASVYISDNQWVKTGDLLIEIKPEDFKGKLNVALASVEAAKAELKKAEAQSGVYMASLERCKAEADSAEAKHQRDLTDLKRCQEMARTNTVSQQDLDHAVASERISAHDLAAAKKQIEAQIAMMQQAEAALKTAEAHLDRANAEAEIARLNLSYVKIYSPADGFITGKSVESGQYVQTGQSLFAVVSKTVWVIANFKETQLTRMSPGQSVKIKADAYPDIILHGHIDSIRSGTGARFSLLPPENATGNFVKVVQRVPVKIVFDRPDEIKDIRLGPGMSVVPVVSIGEKRNKGDVKNGSHQENVIK